MLIARYVDVLNGTPKSEDRRRCDYRHDYGVVAASRQGIGCRDTECARGATRRWSQVLRDTRWVGWYRERLRGWPDANAAESQLVSLGDADHRAKLQALLGSALLAVVGSDRLCGMSVAVAGQHRCDFCVAATGERAVVAADQIVRPSFSHFQRPVWVW
jgi:hypothetical protein